MIAFENAATGASSNSLAYLPIRNCESFCIDDIPVVSFETFRRTILKSIDDGARLSSFFGQMQDAETLRLFAVLAQDATGTLGIVATDVQESFPSLTPECPQAHRFECEIAEQWGVRPEGHPWLKMVRYHRSYAAGCDAWGRTAGQAIDPCVGDFFQVAGEEVHEVAVGPVHAGIIEPGHLRFQCHGENVAHLEIALGYQHRGIERALIGGPNKRTAHQMEVIAGDTTVGHSLAYCQVLGALASTPAPARAGALRGICLELERMANHAGDLGALAGDVGFLPTASFCGRLRGSFLNMTALLCGNRFGRGMLLPGGVRYDADEARLEDLIKRLDETMRDLTGAIDLLWETPSVMARFEETGAISLDLAREIGLVGPAARACGAELDVRHDFPAGIYRFASIPVSTYHSGDVFARAFVRWLEIQRSAAFIHEQVRSLPQGPIQAAMQPLGANMAVVSMAEGWRGEICHVAMTNEAGNFSRYKIVDPSFHNWFGLAQALRNQQISDFPLCNKSFNLSYCGHDL